MSMDMDRWMESLQDNKQLNSIILPASHDSGMAYSTTNVKTLAATTKNNACTQELTIGEQLKAGIRWVDVRLKNTGSRDRCFHGSAFGQESASVAQDIISFLDDNPAEVVIVLLTKSGDDTYKRFLDNLKKSNKSTDSKYKRFTRKPLSGRFHCYLWDK